MTDRESPSPWPATGRLDAQSLASSLAPAMIETSEGRLSDIRWFRADWQRGGAATGKAIYVDDDGEPRRAVVKIPVGDSELRWMQRLQSDDGGDEQVVPLLFASGDSLAGYDLGWIIIEELPAGPLGSHWNETCIPRIARAAAKFFCATARYPIDREPSREDWDALLGIARDNIQTNSLPERQRWTRAVKSLQSKLERIVGEWRARPIQAWVHGDLQPANAMCRSDRADAPVTLIDLAEVRPGHWVEDAVYLERLHWARPERLREHKPVRELAHALKNMGFAVPEGYQHLATIRRALFAGTAPRFLSTEGNQAHLAACLTRLEASLAELKAAGI